MEQLNEEIKRRTRVVGIVPNDASITRLVGAVLLEQDESQAFNHFYDQVPVPRADSSARAPGWCSASSPPTP